MIFKTESGRVGYKKNTGYRVGFGYPLGTDTAVSVPNGNGTGIYVDDCLLFKFLLPGANWYDENHNQDRSETSVGGFEEDVGDGICPFLNTTFDWSSPANKLAKCHS